jgi:Tol biopolymer transport system component
VKLTDAAGPTQIEFDPSWSPEGEFIAAASSRDGDFDIWLIDPNTGSYLRNLTDENPDADGNPAFGWVP